MKKVNSIFAYLLILTILLCALSGCAEKTGFNVPNNGTAADDTSFEAPPVDEPGDETSGEVFLDENTGSVETENPVGGDYLPCKHSIAFRRSYESIPDSIMTYFGLNKESCEWFLSDEIREKFRVDREDALRVGHDENGIYPCVHGEITIYGFLKHFNISREAFEEYLDYTGDGRVYDYNVDVLYSGDEELIDKYYSSINDNRETLMADYGEVRLRIELMKLCGVKSPNEECENIFGRRYASIPEIVYHYDIPKDVFMEAYNTVKNDKSASFDEFKLVDLDIDRIYNESESLKAQIAAAKSSKDIFAIDESLRLSSP